MSNIATDALTRANSHASQHPQSPIHKNNADDPTALLHNLWFKKSSPSNENPAWKALSKQD